jgi:hypothetical protein
LQQKGSTTLEMASATASEMISEVALETSNQTFEAAISSFKESISPEDALAFQETSPEDVWKALDEIELAQRQRKSLCNLRRVEPFLKGLDSYSKVIEAFCNGDPYIPWLWVIFLNQSQINKVY